MVLVDDCPAAWAEFEGRQGVFIEGQVTPPLSGVEIVITSSGKKPMADIKVLTDDQGKYRSVVHSQICSNTLSPKTATDNFTKHQILLGKIREVPFKSFHFNYIHKINS